MNECVKWPVTIGVSVRGCQGKDFLRQRWLQDFVIPSSYIHNRQRYRQIQWTQNTLRRIALAIQKVKCAGVQILGTDLLCPLFNISRI